jgi:hypothetical protein
VLFDGLDLVGPISAGFVGVGNSCGILALGLGEMVEEDFEVLLGSWAGHRKSVSPWDWRVAERGAPPPSPSRTLVSKSSDETGWVWTRSAMSLDWSEKVWTGAGQPGRVLWV